jgi:hypothetical protein
MVPDLTDILKSKRAAGRPQDLAPLDVLERTLSERKTRTQATLDALKRETDRALTIQIRALLRLPPEKRRNFLRKRIGIQPSCL